MIALERVEAEARILLASWGDLKSGEVGDAIYSTDRSLTLRRDEDGLRLSTREGLLSIGAVCGLRSALARDFSVETDFRAGISYLIGEAA